MKDPTNNVIEKPNIMKKIATFIVTKRFIFYLLFLIAIVYCALSIGKVRINSDITAFLPSDTETRQGLTIMENEFITYATANVMLSNLTYEKAEALSEELEEIQGVCDVNFEDTAAHYTSSSAFLKITFCGEQDDPKVLSVMDDVRNHLSSYDDVYISTEIGYDLANELAQEMLGVILLSVLVIIAVILFTSRSYFEVVIFFMIFITAAILNMGTNYLLGEISSITNSIAIILQLALAIDYAIIFCHRYQDESIKHATTKDAVIESLSKAIVEISSSSLTTLAGLAALMTMQFGLGFDLGLVLSKGIICSLLSVFLLMPGLIMLFPNQMERSRHKSLVPNVRPWGNFLVRHKYLFSGIFLLLLPFAIYFSGKCDYAFANSSLDYIIPSEQRLIDEKIRSTFEDETMIAVLIPRGNYDSEKAILTKVSNIDKVGSATGLANTEIDNGYTLTDRYTPRMFSELLDIDIEESSLLYKAYGISRNEYQAVFNDDGEYSVPLIDMFLYLFEMRDQGVITLDAESDKNLKKLRTTLERALEQLRGENYCRLLFTAAVPEEGEESVLLVEQIREIAQDHYLDGQVLVVGDITSSRDLAESFNSDNWKINLLTVLFVFILLLLTFRSVVGAMLLVFVIQGSIWINFSFAYLSGKNIFFITNLIVSAIQMGATIDYAIVMMSRYQELKTSLQPREAIAEMVKQSFPTVFTSGSILTAAGFLIAYRTTDIYVGSIGLALGRGAFISVILVLTVLPQFIYILDKPIDKTRFRLDFLLGDDK